MSRRSRSRIAALAFLALSTALLGARQVAAGARPTPAPENAGGPAQESAPGQGPGQGAGQGAAPARDAYDALLFPRTIVVVRHAEKAAGDPADPDLAEVGRQRAEALSKLLSHAGVTKLFASEFKRTRQTLEPLAAATGVDIEVVSARDPAALLSALAEVPRHGVAVVAGHSNTVPGLVAALAPTSALVKEHPEALRLAEADYDRCFVVTQWGRERAASVLELRY